MDRTAVSVRHEAWNKGKLVGQKAPLKVKDIWAIRVRLQIQGRTRDLAMLDLGIDSKLRGCDLVKLRVRDAHTLADARSGIDLNRAGVSFTYGA